MLNLVGRDGRSANITCLCEAVHVLVSVAASCHFVAALFSVCVKSECMAMKVAVRITLEAGCTI